MLTRDSVRRVKEFLVSPSYTFWEKNILWDLLSSMSALLLTTTSSLLVSRSVVWSPSSIPPKPEFPTLFSNVDLLVLRLSWLLVINLPLLPPLPDKSTLFLKVLELLMKLLKPKIFLGKKLLKSVMLSLFMVIRLLNLWPENLKNKRKNSPIWDLG